MSILKYARTSCTDNRYTENSDKPCGSVCVCLPVIILDSVLYPYYLLLSCEMVVRLRLHIVLYGNEHSRTPCPKCKTVYHLWFFFRLYCISSISQFWAQFRTLRLVTCCEVSSARLCRGEHNIGGCIPSVYICWPSCVSPCALVSSVVGVESML